LSAGKREGFKTSLALICTLLHVGSGVCAPTEAKRIASEITEAEASALTKMGTTFVVGTYNAIRNGAKKSEKNIESATISSDQSSAFVKQYQTRVRDGEFGANLLHSNLEAAITTGQVLGSSTGALAIPTTVVATFARVGNNKVRDYLVGDAVAKAAAMLGADIDKMNRQDKLKFESLLAQKKWSAAEKQFDKSTGRLSAIRRGLGNDASAIAIVDSAIHSTLLKGSTAAIKIAGQAYEKADHLDNQFTHHVKGFNAFTTKAVKSFKQLDEGVKNLKASMKSATERINAVEKSQNTTALQIQVMQDIMYDDQSPAVKLALLDSGAKPTLTGEPRESVKAILNTQIAQQNLIDKTNKVLGYARDMNTIMTNFGVQDKGLNQAVQYGSVASTALSQAFSGNYLGAIASVSGLFGGNGPDPLQQQLQHQFEQVFQELSKIDKKLDDVITLQKQTLDDIAALSRQLAAAEVRLSQRFNRVDFELSILNDKVEQVLWKEINRCATAWNRRTKNGLLAYDEATKRFPSYSALTQYTKQNADVAYDCQARLMDLYSGMRDQDFSGNPFALSLVNKKVLETFGTPEALEKDQDGKSPLERFVEFHSDNFNMLRFSWARHVSWGGLASAYALLATPSATATDLKARIDYLTKLEVSLAACKSKDTVVGLRMRSYLCSAGYQSSDDNERDNDDRALKIATNFLETPIVTRQISQLTKYAAFVAGPSDLAKGSGTREMFTLDDLIQKGGSSKGRDLITGALMVSDVSIAQQAMLYGDLTAWFVFDQVWDSSTNRFRATPASESETGKNLFALATALLRNANNPWLQRNVLMLILQSAEKRCTSASGEETCKNRELLYQLGYDKFFPTEGQAGTAKLVVPSVDAVMAGRNWMLGLFKINQDVSFEVSDTGSNKSAPRMVILKLDGYMLPMPSIRDWKTKALVYPPIMYERLNDHAVLAQRLADYTVFDDMDPTLKLNLVRVTTKGVQ
jgi:hypothetical protein